MVIKTLAAAATGVVFVLSLSLPVSAAGTMKYEVKDDAIQASLTGKAGDAANGKKLVINRKKGNCLACHAMPIPEQAFHGNIGPDLNGVGSRYEIGELRLRVVDSKIVNEDTIMPAFYREAGLNRVLKKFKGKSVLAAQDVEDIVAYLTTLKD